MEELRDTHRLEGTSQTDLIKNLRQQLSVAENNLNAKAGDLVQLGSLKSDLLKAQQTAKEEEEKRTKAISLLKTVRQKNVKVEREKEEMARELAEARADRTRALEDVEKVKADKEREVTNLRKGFERELSSAKERADKELAARKGAWELEMITTKAGHAKELSAQRTKIASLEASVKELTTKTSEQFSALQSRQAEAEGARAELESVRGRTNELEFQLREAREQLTLLEDAPRRSAPPSRAPSPSRAVDVQKLLADADARADAKISELKARVRALERERTELEEDWAAKLAQRVRELESLRSALGAKEGEAARAAEARKERDARLDAADAARRELERQMSSLRAEVESARADVAVAAEAERVARDELAAAQGGTAGVQAQLDEARAAADRMKAANRTLRDELRKVQSSAQLLERQRGPGVGYWAQNQGAQQPQSPATASPPQSTSPKPEEEEVNLEYLRNVILQFLENPQMRPNLVRVLSVILRFTPQELRRLNAKLMT
jgi:chromosome segregation ATPase